VTDELVREAQPPLVEESGLIEHHRVIEGPPRACVAQEQLHVAAQAEGARRADLQDELALAVQVAAPLLADERVVEVHAAGDSHPRGGVESRGLLPLSHSTGR